MTTLSNVRIRLARAKQRNEPVTLSPDDAAILLRNLDLIPDRTQSGDYSHKSGLNEVEAGLQRQFAFEDAKKLVKQVGVDSVVGIPL